MIGQLPSAVFEVEQKFPVADRPRLERELSALGVTFDPGEVQNDRYFAHPARDFGRTDEALRIRQTADGSLITYKGPKIDTSTKTRREIELQLVQDQDAAPFAELLCALGFRPVADVRKCRRRAKLFWQDHDVEIALDEVEGLGEFVELEVSADDESLDAARNAVADLAQRLGLHGGERRSYLELLEMTARERGGAMARLDPDDDGC